MVDLHCIIIWPRYGRSAWSSGQDMSLVQKVTGLVPFKGEKNVQPREVCQKIYTDRKQYTGQWPK